MNCISSLKVRASLLCLVCCAACGAQVSESLVPSDPLTYRLDYRVDPDPMTAVVTVTLTVSQNTALLREMKMRPDARISNLKADGTLDIRDAGVRWLPPVTGGAMSWQVNVAHRRNGDGYDAWLGADWGLFRAEDIIPRAATRTLKNARSESWITFRLPRGWAVVSQYFSRNGQSRIDIPERRFDQPSGWIVLGDLGVRRETITGVRVAVAGPVSNSVRRMDTLALLNWTLPELARLLPELPSRLTIVSAGEPMWRGGLSAPQSLFIHAGRPLISENATSTVLHEVMHLALALDTQDGYDWIAEGLAEYYSLQLLRRSGTISESRYALARADLADWATTASSLCRQSSSGATTALAVGILAALDEEIRELTTSDASLDSVVVDLVQLDEPINLGTLTAISEQIAANKVDALHIDKLPGCRTIATGEQGTTSN